MVPVSVLPGNLSMLKFSEQDPYSPNRCRKRAMDALARREHSRAELEQKLAERGFPADTVAATLDRLCEENLQSDERFVESFIASRYRQGKGPIRIVAELGNKGVPTSTVHEVLATTAFDWFERAADVRRQKFGEAMPTDFPSKAKQMRFLSYRGFTSEQVQSAVDR